MVSTLSALSFLTLCILGTASTGGAVSLDHRRSLKDIQATTSSTYTVYNITAFNVPFGNGNRNCVIQGYPGSRADSVVPGPLTLVIPRNVLTVKLNFAPASSTSPAIVLYSASRNVVTANSTATGLTQAVWYRDTTPSSPGSITAGLITDYNPNDPAHDASSNATCLVNVNFISELPAPAPAPGLPTFG